MIRPWRDTSGKIVVGVVVVYQLCGCFATLLSRSTLHPKMLKVLVRIGRCRPSGNPSLCIRHLLCKLFQYYRMPLVYQRKRFNKDAVRN